MSDNPSGNARAEPHVRNGRIAAPTPRELEERRGAIAVGRILRAIHRHVPLMLAAMTFTTTFALIAFRQAPLYRANAVMRVVGERRAVAPALDPTDANLDDRHIVLVNSLVPRVRSRAVIGAVVDSLGLQLRPVPIISLFHPPELPAIALKDIHVHPRATPDTLTVLFARDHLTVRYEGMSKREAYGRPVTAAGAQFIVSKRPAATGAVLAIAPRDWAIDRVLSQLAVVPLAGTDALEVRYIDPDPELAKAITNQVVRTFYASTVNSSQEQARRRRVFLEGQLEEGDRQLGQAQAGLTGFRSRGRLARSSDKLARQQSDLMTLDARRGELQADRRVFNSVLRRLESADDSARTESLYTLAYSPEVATDPIVGKLFQQLLTYGARLDSLTSGPYQSSATNPDVLQLRQMLKSSEGALVRAVRGRLSSIDERLAALQSLRNRNAGEIAMLPVLEAEEERLGHRVSALADFSNQLRLEYQKARMAEALAAADIEIVDLATLPYMSSGVPWWFKVALAMVFGFVVGTVLSLLLELKNHSIRAPEDIEEVLHLRGLGVIPPVQEAIAGEEALTLARASGGQMNPAGARARGVVADSPVWPSAGTEAFRLLYSSLTINWGDHQRTILVTSVTPREGKTLVAANLAVTFAREGARVLLVDCDLRRPRLHKIFQVSRSPGLVELLRPSEEAEREAALAVDEPRPLEHAYSMLADLVRHDATTPADSSGEAGPTTNDKPDSSGEARPTTNGKAPTPAAPRREFHRLARLLNIRETRNHNVWLLPCGAVDGSGSQTIKATAVRGLLAQVADDFDVIILDTAPVLVSADAVILAPVVDDVLLVVRAGHTDREAADLAQQQLSDAGGNVVGAVLNDPEGKVGRDRLLYYHEYGYPVSTD
jgi:Mrp family chromosome partitioning ATPase/uncharacterized protein involved in exopolysaccharide biosynthesis